MLTLHRPAGGDNWESWKDNLHYFDYSVAAVIIIGAL